ncbi:MAG: type 4a pilus biogenesis protein PilO [Candidatus Aureabacteria bacterium]|nr:type 4a pilus biogenesis protein PilO [Candidatus Auribacterota bacterium]
MAKKSMTRFEQMGIIALVVVIACFFYVKKVYDPESKKFKALRKKCSKLFSEVRILKWQQKEGKDIFVLIEKNTEKLREEQTKFGEVRLSLAGREDLPQVLTAINQIAAANNLRINEFKDVDASSKTDKLKTEEMYELRRSRHSLVMFGNFVNFKAFLKSIGQLPKLVTVENVVIERERKRDILKITLLIAI